MFSLKRRAVASDACTDLHANEQNTEREREGNWEKERANEYEWKANLSETRLL